MPTEDLTTFTEVDPDGDLTVTADTIVADTVRNDVVAHVYKDFGAAHFGDFTHEFAGEYTYKADASNFGYWAVTDDVGAWRYWNDGIVVHWLDSGNTRFYNIDDGYSADEFASSVGVPYYFTVVRSSTTGECRIYGDAARTNLLDTLSITTSTNAKRYLYAFLTGGWGGSSASSGWCGYYDINEVQLAGTAAAAATATGALSVQLAGTAAAAATATGALDVHLAGYDWYLGEGAESAIDWDNRIAHTAPGSATVVLGVVVLTPLTNYYLVCKAVSNGGVASVASLVRRVMVDEAGDLIGPPPNKPVSASIFAIADGYIRLVAFYNAVNQQGVATGLQVARVVAGVPDWDSLIQSISISGSARIRKTLDTQFSHGETVRLAIRAVTAAGITGDHLLTNTVNADRQGPAALTYLEALQHA